MHTNTSTSISTPRKAAKKMLCDIQSRNSFILFNFLFLNERMYDGPSFPWTHKLCAKRLFSALFFSLMINCTQPWVDKLQTIHRTITVLPISFFVSSLLLSMTFFILYTTICEITKRHHIGYSFVTLNMLLYVQLATAHKKLHNNNNKMATHWFECHETPIKQIQCNIHCDIKYFADSISFQ